MFRITHCFQQREINFAICLYFSLYAPFRLMHLKLCFVVFFHSHTAFHAEQHNNQRTWWEFYLYSHFTFQKHSLPTEAFPLLESKKKCNWLCPALCSWIASMRAHSIMHLSFFDSLLLAPQHTLHRPQLNSVYCPLVFGPLCFQHRGMQKGEYIQ